jgi:hypothetical protein
MSIKSENLSSSQEEIIMENRIISSEEVKQNELPVKTKTENEILNKSDE